MAIPTFDIWGSCVTRDSLEFITKCHIGYYCTRQSIISACSTKPSQHLIDSIIIDDKEPNFIRKSIMNDLNKTSLGRMKQSPSTNILIVDFTDDVSPLFRDNDALVTYSHFARNYSNMAKLLKKRIHSFSKEYERLFKENIAEFAQAISFVQGENGEAVPRKTIIVHRAFLADTDSCNARKNVFLSKLYDMLEENLSNCISIEVPKYLRISSPLHKWGPHAFHYIDEYYICFIDLLRKHLPDYTIDINDNCTMQYPNEEIKSEFVNLEKDIFLNYKLNTDQKTNELCLLLLKKLYANQLMLSKYCYHINAKWMMINFAKKIFRKFNIIV